jgi:hypothetical protein
VQPTPGSVGFESTAAPSCCKGAGGSLVPSGRPFTARSQIRRGELDVDARLTLLGAGIVLTAACSSGTKAVLRSSWGVAPIWAFCRLTIEAYCMIDAVAPVASAEIGGGIVVILVVGSFAGATTA